MISSSKSKLIRSLRQKKFRDRHRLFMIEGEKMVMELVSRERETPYRIRELIGTPEWINPRRDLLRERNMDFTEAGRPDIERLSTLVTPQPVIALVDMPGIRFSTEELKHIPVLAFESIRDPGNLGTIIRTADWFGIRHIVCTPDSTDLYNPKVLQSTMGAFARVQVHYMDLEELLKGPGMQTRKIIGTYMEGENIYESSLGPDPVILFGNESRGLSGELGPYIRYRITIPSFSANGPGSESLNVASSVAVVCSELRRR